MGNLENYPRISPYLWCNNNAEEAVDFYLSIFPNSRKLDTLTTPGDSPGTTKVLIVSFDLDGQKFTALNGGPLFQFNESISFVVRCDTQEEIDNYWSRLSAGGKEGQCGWLKDKFGMSWQVVPGRIGDLIRHPKAMQAMMQMKKIVIAQLEEAARE